MSVDPSRPSEERVAISRSQHLASLFERARSSGTVGYEQIRDAVSSYVNELIAAGKLSPDVLFAVRQTLATQILVSGTDLERDESLIQHFVSECTRAFYRTA